MNVSWRSITTNNTAGSGYFPMQTVVAINDTEYQASGLSGLEQSFVHKRIADIAERSKHQVLFLNREDDIIKAAMIAKNLFYRDLAKDNLSFDVLQPWHLLRTQDEKETPALSWDGYATTRDGCGNTDLQYAMRRTVGKTANWIGYGKNNAMKTILDRNLLVLILGYEDLYENDETRVVQFQVNTRTLVPEYIGKLSDAAHTIILLPRNSYRATARGFDYDIPLIRAIGVTFGIEHMTGANLDYVAT